MQGIGRYVTRDVTDLTCCGRRLYTSGGATVSHLAKLTVSRVGVALRSMLATMPMDFVNWSTFSAWHPAANM